MKKIKYDLSKIRPPLGKTHLSWVTAMGKMDISCFGGCVCRDKGSSGGWGVSKPPVSRGEEWEQCQSHQTGRQFISYVTAGLERDWAVCVCVLHWYGLSGWYSSNDMKGVTQFSTCWESSLSTDTQRHEAASACFADVTLLVFRQQLFYGCACWVMCWLIVLQLACWRSDSVILLSVKWSLCQIRQIYTRLDCPNQSQLTIIHNVSDVIGKVMNGHKQWPPN